jgi:hypothetical protein
MSSGTAAPTSRRTRSRPAGRQADYDAGKKTTTLSHKKEKVYRSYLCTRGQGYDACPIKTVPAGDIEAAVLIQLRKVFQTPEVTREALRIIQAREESDRVRLGAERT